MSIEFTSTKLVRLLVESTQQLKHVQTQSARINHLLADLKTGVSDHQGAGIAIYEAEQARKSAQETNNRVKDLKIDFADELRQGTWGGID